MHRSTINKESVDYLVVPDPYFPFDNEGNLSIIKVPAILFMKRIKPHIDDYFPSLCT